MLISFVATAATIVAVATVTATTATTATTIATLVHGMKTFMKTQASQSCCHINIYDVLAGA